MADTTLANAGRESTPGTSFVSVSWTLAGLYACDTVYVTAWELDLDVDSKNDSGFSEPDDNPEEDRLERVTGTGKLVFATTGDVDRDGIVDAADFGGITGANFVPMAVRLSDNVWEGSTSIQVYFDYDSSVFRLWKPGFDAETVRTEHNIVPARRWVNAEEIGLEPGVGDRTVYVEALKGTSGAMPITTSVQVEGERSRGTVKDTVHLVPVEVDLDVYADTGASPQSIREPLPQAIEDGAGAVIWRNSDFSRKLPNRDTSRSEPGVPRYLPDHRDQTAIDPDYASQFTQAKAVFTGAMAEAFGFRFDIGGPSLSGSHSSTATCRAIFTVSNTCCGTARGHRLRSSGLR